MCQGKLKIRAIFEHPVIVKLGEGTFWLAPGQATTSSIAEAAVYEANSDYLKDRDVGEDWSNTEAIPVDFLSGVVFVGKVHPSITELLDALTAPDPINRYAVNCNGVIGRITEVGNYDYRGYTFDGDSWAANMKTAIILERVDYSW